MFRGAFFLNVHIKYLQHVKLIFEMASSILLKEGNFMLKIHVKKYEEKIIEIQYPHVYVFDKSMIMKKHLQNDVCKCLIIIGIS